MASKGDVTIDIPLTPRLTKTGSRSQGQSSTQYEDEKSDPSARTLRHPGRRRKTQDDLSDSLSKSAESPEDGTLNRLGRIYMAILNFSFVTRYLIYITPIALIIAVPIVIGATIAKNARIGGTIVDGKSVPGVRMCWFFSWIEILWISLWMSKILARVLPYLFQFLCGFVSSGTRKYALVLRALETPITIFFWTIVSLASFLPMMTQTPGDRIPTPTSWETYVHRILFALLVCSIIFLVEKTIVQLISIGYHRKQFDSKIKISKHNVYLLSLLYEASRNMFPVYCPEFADEDSLIFDSILAQPVGKKDRSSSAYKSFQMMRQVGQHVGRNVGRIGDKVTAAFGNVASELTGKQVFAANSSRSIVNQALERKRCAEALARRIWMSFVVEGHESLYLEDIVEVLGEEHQAEAEECFAALDKDGNGDISLDEMIVTITELGRTKKSLNHSMHDVDQAIHVLDNLLMVVASIIGVLVFLSFVTSGFGTVLAAGATTLLSLSFIFSLSAQEVLASCIFIFVKHPFDIGDRVDILDKCYVVDGISLLFTVLRNINDQRTTQVPNNILNSLWIDNITRASAMYERLTVPVHFDTTFADIQFLREEMERFVRDKDNCRDFQPDFNVEVVGLGETMEKLDLRVEIRHKSNWSNETVRAARRSKFMCALVLAIRKIPIRAPGIVGAEEVKADDNNGDDNNPFNDKSHPASPSGNAGKPGPQNGGAGGQNGTSQMGVAAATVTAASGVTNSTSAQTSGFDGGQSTATLTQRGPANQAEREAAIVGQLNTRAPHTDYARDDHDDNGLYRTATVSSSHSRQQFATQRDPFRAGFPSREPSTGRRKEGSRVSVLDQDTLPPLSPVRSGASFSPPRVPTLGAPTPPVSRGNARYDPKSQAASMTFQNQKYLNQYSYAPAAQDSRNASGVTLAGMEMADIAEMTSPYDPISPASQSESLPPAFNASQYGSQSQYRGQAQARTQAHAQAQAQVQEQQQIQASYAVTSLQSNPNPAGQ